MFIPSNRWYPTTIQERAGWHVNLDAQAQVSGLSLGLTAGEITQIEKDKDVMVFLAQADIAIDTYADAVRAYRKTVTEGEIGDATPIFPPDISLSLPGVVPTGIFRRTDDYVTRIRASAAYTPETGAAYRIIPSSPDKPAPGDSKPTITGEVKPGNVVLVSFKKEGASGVYIEMAVDKGDFGLAGSFRFSPATITVPQNADHLPRAVQIRARFLDRDTPVGDWSDTVNVQTVP